MTRISRTRIIIFGHDKEQKSTVTKMLRAAFDTGIYIISLDKNIEIHFIKHAPFPNHMGNI